jgi:hypothetical protein
MRLGRSRGLLQSFLLLREVLFRHGLGPGLSCLAAMAASPYMRSGPQYRPAPECLMHEAWPRRHATHLKRGGVMPTKDEDGRAPLSPPTQCCRRRFLLGYAEVGASARISAPAGTTPVSA